MKEILIYFLISFGTALVCTPFVFWTLKKIRARQEILHYVDWHKSKSGTPTMGGWIFILPILILSPFILSSGTPLCNIAVIATLGYGILGCLDDYLKISREKNLGLRAYQKFIGQGGIAILVGVFYYLANPDGRIFVPFLNATWDIGFWILPLTVFVLVATTNSVNLTDGVDGLAGSVSLVYCAVLAIFIAISSKLMPMQESNTLLILVAIICGGLLCYLLFNTNKAKIFMGDTGSLFLGGIIATLSMFSLMGLFIPILGIMFVLSAATDIIQVTYFKITKKRTGTGRRVFLMAPFHHHLEKKGWTEARIVALYCTVTILLGIVCVITLV
ncbi:MAG: phospho-N-acetylmuramoyl-pentapeptide-transferase [Christensenellaceae bacterium]|jgi:phospho-N-acetylmuramoyl-pentapeptide-transferase|nr:phospho-N-acetylmuramoyl-pentapeptide-transferase [Christensenellaceae bacterium]